MHKQTLLTTLAIGVIAASNVATAQSQQGTGNARSQIGVISAAPIYSDSMVALQRSAQRLRETIQSLAQRAPGPDRDEAMRAARDALYDTQQAMIRLPPEYRISGITLSNVPIAQGYGAQNRTYGDSMRELQLAADRLRDAIQKMAQHPAGSRRNEAIKQAHQALFETQHAMAWVPGYPAMASSGEGRRGADMSSQGKSSTQSGFGSVGGGITAGSDASDVQASVPAVAGGVGLNARTMLSNEARPEHNVKMLFSLDTGNYLADVGVQVRDQKGRNVIDGVSDGPWLFAKLQPGNYTATATYNGQSVTKQFSVGRSGQHVAHFRWPASVERSMVSGVSPILGTGPQNMQ
jgi:hypothetical protein